VAEDLSKLNQPKAMLFQRYARPVLWTNREELDMQGEVEAEPTKFRFGYWCGSEEMCLIPLQPGEERIGYWRCPTCDSADDAKRIWLIVQKLMDAVDGDL
jgi:hypothetical protein